ncbi:MAG: cadherin-like beta sandwich domain-containing protein [Clostridia bacterium]|nr:cadherin-like beta sandwich domain-containing protein [Clostridia bacterium]
MKKLTKISSVITIIVLMLSCIIVPASAKGTTLYFSKNTLEVGDKVTVSVSVNPEESMYAVSFYLQYDDSVLKYESGAGKGGAGALQVIESPSGDKKVSYSFEFSALAVGTSNISITDCIYVTESGGDSKEVSFTGASASMTVRDAKLSSNAKLKSLKISGYSLNESFSSSKTSYTAKVPYETKKVSIVATASSEKAKIKSVEGNTDLKVGSNTVIVTVEAENGTQKEYKIKITRQEKEDVSSQEDTASEEDTSNQEETTQDDATVSDTSTTLETIIDGKTYLIATEIPKKALFDGFIIKETNVNGYSIETAVDADNNYRLFYLMEKDSEILIPFSYDQELDAFERVNYITIGENSYIFATMPEDITLPDTYYPSSLNFSDFSVECFVDTNSEMTEFKYVYCFFDGNFAVYRYDSAQETIQRYPELELKSKEVATKQDNVFTRFGSLSTNGKIIIVTLFIVVLGVLSLLILLVVYLVRRSLNLNNDIVLYQDENDDFDAVEIETETQES